MILHFETEAVEIEETELDVLIVGFYTDENYLMIQQSIDGYDEQDEKLGMNSYHIERDDQSFGGYGGVKQIHLQRNTIEVELDEIGQQNLQCDGVKVDFDTDDETYQTLAEKLKSIFGSSLVIK
ncbi:MAG TPA: Imm10 family immunity protein [Pyrinomonadaceae bacterium]|nr:Imm10 family immunity protein [Pyrinomonadaceae bacterium]